MAQNDSEQWEKKTQGQKTNNGYRFGGVRYGARGTSYYKCDEMIPQVTGLYAFPREDAQNFEDRQDNPEIT